MHFKSVLILFPFLFILILNHNYQINGDLIASLNWGGGLFSSLKKTITNRKYTWCHQYIEIEFDENKISPLIALCILMKRVCRESSNT